MNNAQVFIIMFIKFIIITIINNIIYLIVLNFIHALQYIYFSTHKLNINNYQLLYKVHGKIFFSI